MNSVVGLHVDPDSIDLVIWDDEAMISSEHDNPAVASLVDIWVDDLLDSRISESDTSIACDDEPVDVLRIGCWDNSSVFLSLVVPS